MDMQVFGAGTGRTGTYSLKLAINQLGLGPCHHMEEVLFNQAEQVPLWASAVNGKPIWPAIYDGYASTVDWPTAGFSANCMLPIPLPGSSSQFAAPKAGRKAFRKRFTN